MRLPLAKGAAEHGEAEGFAPTETRRGFKKCRFQIILPYRKGKSAFMRARVRVCMRTYIFSLLYNKRCPRTFGFHHPVISPCAAAGGSPPRRTEKSNYMLRSTCQRRHSDMRPGFKKCRFQMILPYLNGKAPFQFMPRAAIPSRLNS